MFEPPSNLPEEFLPLGLVLCVGEQVLLLEAFETLQAGFDVVGGCCCLGNNVFGNLLLWPPECFRSPRTRLAPWISIRRLKIFFTPFPAIKTVCSISRA